MSSSPATALRRVWRRLPIGVRRTAGQAILWATGPWLAARLPKAATAIRPMAGDPTIMGVFQAALGHGTAARLLAMELANAGLTPAVADVTAQVGADVNDPRATPQALGSQQGPLILAINPDTALVALAGRQRRLLQNRPVIGYFVWELESTPASWAKVGHALHAVWSPSRFSARALEAVYGRTVAVVPHPAALAPVPALSAALRAQGRAMIGAEVDDFVAFSSFSATSSLARKNPFGALAAFEAAFGNDRRRHLVLRCLGGHRFPAALSALRQAVRDAKAKVTLIDAPQGLEELHALYAACDLYVSLHRSEGFGLNLAEAMLAGLPVLATGWSGNLDFMDDASAALVDFRLTAVEDPQRIYRTPGARWAEPSLDHAVSHLRHLADNRDERDRLAAAGAATARQRLNGGRAAEELKRWIAL